MKGKKNPASKNNPVKREEKIISEIVQKYGNVIDLKKTPYVIIEIMRTFGKGLPVATDNPCGGVPPSPTPPPPPAPKGPGNYLGGFPVEELIYVMNNLAIEVKNLGKEVSKMSKR